jgi:methyl-accepting chemotaxis protein PixJ
MIWSQDFPEVRFMSGLYQENKENGLHIPEVGKTEVKQPENSNSNLSVNSSGPVNIPIDTNDNISDLNIIEKQFKAWRGTFQYIVSQMRQTVDFDALLQVTTRNLREKVACDRVLIYRFNSTDYGVVLAESRTPDWTPALGENLPAILYGLSTNKDYLEPVCFNDINKSEITPYQRQLLEKFQVKSSLSIPILFNNQVWGLLVVHNCYHTRQWQELEVSLLSQISNEITHKLQAFEFEKKLQKQTQESQSVTKVLDKIQRASSLDKIFQTTTQEVRQLIHCDRIAVYRFNSDWSGEFVAESMSNECKKLVGPGIKTIWEDTHLQETQGGRYRYNEITVVRDIYGMNYSPCHVEILEQFQVKAYIVIPVFSNQKLWGLLAAYENSETRDWQEWEVQSLKQFAISFGVAVYQAESIQQSQEQSQKLARTAERQQNLIALTRKIGEALIDKAQDSSQFETILQTTVAEVRRLLQADRTVVYRFNNDWSGDFIAESMAKGWIPFKEKEIDKALLKENGHCDNIRGLASIYKEKDSYMQDTKGGRYQQKAAFVVNDVEQAGFPPCYSELLEQFEAKAYLTVPIFKENQLWGLLASYQHSGTRQWEEVEISAMIQIAVLLGVAIQQTESLQKLQQQSQEVAKSAERDRALAKVIEKIRQSLDIENIFNTTAREVRSLLATDRVAVYRFNEDWGGAFVSESVAPNWVTLIDKQYKIPRLEESVSACYSMRKLIQSSQPSQGKQENTDTYLQMTQGGELRSKKIYVRNDIYQAEFSDCYIEVLEQYQCRAYAIVPIFQGQKLWGMLAAYQNSAPREWEEAEVNLLVKIGDQLGVALQQAEYLQQLQAKSQQLQQAALQKQLVSKIVERIRESTDLETVFNSTAREVRRALNSDRVGIYRFRIENGDFEEGEFVAEDVLPGFVSVIKGKIKEYHLDYHFNGQQVADYREGKVHAISDIYNAGLSEPHIEILAKLQIRANLIVPLIKGSELWGLLCIHQCNAPREWQEQEISLVNQISDQFGVALQQAEYLQKLQEQSTQVAQAAAREKSAKEYLQKAAIQLLAAVRPALNGDLTVRAPITEDELGTIADAYNNTLQALRQIVIQVQQAAQKVAQTSANSEAGLSGLTNLAQQQSEEINEALGEIQQVVDSTQAVVANTEMVQKVVEQANETVEFGDLAMNRTVEAIQAIRDTVAQTGKKIKRLSESSQKISKVVNLISNFATQTNVLALNAAIEATRAGEYGKGFAVVADEVRSLSRQSAAATIEIEKLVQEIQEETGDVAVAMETGIQQVVEGTNLVNETRQNLNAIVAATAEISKLLQQITEANQAQMLQSISATTSMKDVASLAKNTSSEAKNIAIVFQELSGMAQELLASASKFKVN